MFRAYLFMFTDGAPYHEKTVGCSNRFLCDGNGFCRPVEERQEILLYLGSSNVNAGF